MTKENLKKLPLVLLVRLPIMGTLVLLNIIGGYLWDYSDRAIDYLNDKLPGLKPDDRT